VWDVKPYYTSTIFELLAIEKYCDFEI